MKKTLLIILLLSLSVGFSQQNWNIAFMKEYGGLTYSPNSDKPYTGKVYSFYENGKRYSEGTYKDGEEDGVWTKWYENGPVSYTHLRAHET